MGELNFQYADSDTYRAELSELYTYTEMDEFALNYDCFVKYMRDRKEEPFWIEIPHQAKCKILQNLVGNFESVEAEQRLESARIILYILQGAYGDFAEMESKSAAAVGTWIDGANPFSRKEDEDSEENAEGLAIPEKWFGPEHGTGGFESDCLTNAAYNAFLVYEQGLFQPLCSLLRLEASLPFERYADHSRQSSVSNSRSASHMDLAAGGAADGAGSACGTLDRRRAKRSATLADNERIRVVLNCLYHMVEAMRREEMLGRVSTLWNRLHPSRISNVKVDRLQTLRGQFLSELEEPLEHSKTPLLIQLFEMMPSFVRAKTPHYPIKKILLLCWKVLLATLGGIYHLRGEKERKRRELVLPLVEDTLKKAVQMKPILNCGLSTGFLGLGGPGGPTAGESEAARQLGRKVRSIHNVRPFNRQVACSSNSGQDTPTTGQRERSNAFSEDDGPEQEEANRMDSTSRELDKEDFESVNDAIMPAGEEETEENEPNADENEDSSSADLLDQMLEELSSNVADEEEEEEGSGSGEAQEKTDNRLLEPNMANPRITVSEEEKQDNNNEPRRKTEMGIAAEGRRPSVEARDEAANDLRRRLIAVQIDRKVTTIQHQQESGGGGRNGNDGGGDQTPKACQSPVKKNSPWPPPSPPGLPWKPKVREADIENFLQNERQKFFDFQLRNDTTTVFGLPDPVHGSLAALRRNIYTTLNEQQLKAEDRYNKFPFSQREFIEDTPTERLYPRVLPCMTEYVIALLKVILASLPSSKAKIDAVTILSDVLTPETDTNEMLSNSISLDLSHLGQNVLEEHVRIAIDINRHKELIIKAASSIIILLLKHFRLNHVYQFENFAQYLVLANCLPLVLKFLDQNICRYFQSKYELAPFNYPQSALYIVRNGNEWPQLTTENVDEGESPNYFLWRNVFSSINLLRVINKLTKGKQARTMMLVVYKSAPVLKRCMRAKLGIFQLYVLKLLKLQARYLGRQWRKSNMDLISAIYLRVRHRLNDDWAYANETTRTKSFDFQREENELGLAIKRFNARRYPHLAKDGAEHSHAGGHDPSMAAAAEEGTGRPAGMGVSGIAVDGLLGTEWDPREWEPMDNSVQSALACEPQLSERFMQNYEQWLEEEVFSRQTDWDSLLQSSRGLLDLYC